MTILLTGSSGFLGRQVLKELEENFPSKELCLISSSSLSTYPTIIRAGSKIQVTKQEEEILKRVTHLVHIGSFIPKNKSEVKRFDLALESINFTYNLINLPTPKLEKVIFVSTVDVYSRNAIPISEGSTTVASNAYTSMKLFCEKMIESHYSISAVPVQIFRTGHLYGEGDEVFDKLIPNLFRAIFEEKTIHLTVGLEQRLNLLYVKDAARLICKSLQNSFKEEIVNLVSSRSVTIRELLTILEGISSKELEFNKLDSLPTTTDYHFKESKISGHPQFVETPIEVALLEVYNNWARRIK